MDTFRGIWMDLKGSWRVPRRSEEFGRKNVIRVLSGGIMCVKYMI